MQVRRIHWWRTRGLGNISAALRWSERSVKYFYLYPESYPKAACMPVSNRWLENQLQLTLSLAIPSCSVVVLLQENGNEDEWGIRVLKEISGSQMRQKRKVRRSNNVQPIWRNGASQRQSKSYRFVKRHFEANTSDWRCNSFTKPVTVTSTAL